MPVDLTQLGQALANFGLLDASLLSTAVLMGVLLRFAVISNGKLSWFVQSHVFLCAALLGTVGAILQLSMEAGRPWQFIALQSAAMTIGTMLVERASRNIIKGDTSAKNPSDPPAPNDSDPGVSTGG